MNPQTREDSRTAVARTIDGLQRELADMSDFIFDHPGDRPAGSQGLRAALRLPGQARIRGWSAALRGCPPPSGRCTRSARAARASGSCANTTPSPASATRAPTTSRAPCILGAAIAIKDQAGDLPYTLDVIGTPAEETVGGKVLMLEQGAFLDLDVALMMHGNDVTQVDLKSLALSEYQLTFHGTSAHAAMAPEDGRSALEAVMLVFNGLAYLRGHVRDDIRIHGIIEEGGQAVNAIPDRAVARIEVRSYDRPYLDQVIGRVQRIIEGAALRMTDTRFTLEKTTEFHSKIPVLCLNDLLMENAERAGARAIEPPRERTGSTDFGNVMYHVPGTCINLPIVDKGISPHTQGYLDRGKSPEAHEAMVLGARTLAMTALDLLRDPSLLDAVQAEFRREKARLQDSTAG